jgi:hypothetical protein
MTAQTDETLVFERTSIESLMAREPQEMPRVMHELVDIGAAEQRRGALFRPDEIDGEQREQAAENGPGQNLADRDDGKGNRLSGRMSHEDLQG